VVSYKSRIKSNIYYIISLSFGGVAFVVLFLVAFKKYRGERKIAAEFDNDRKRQSEQIKKLTEKLKESKLADLDKKRFLFVNNKKIMFDDIIFIRSNGHYVNHYLEKKKLPVLERKNISAVCEELPDNQFVRVHRTTVINIFFIESFTSTEVLLTNGEKINVSRTYKNELQAALGNI
jgi:DNA-binding LytR/AlgR family response regulator